jgi:NADH-quinone oxidoreductase subunit H
MTFDFTWMSLWITLILIAAVVGVIQGLCAYLTLAERKISAWAQDRVGPNRVGPLGLLQPIVDGIKFLLKEEVIPSHVDRLFFLLGPTIAMATALFAFAVVPFGQTTPAPTLIDHRSEVDARVALAPKPLSADELAQRKDGQPDNFDERLDRRFPDRRRPNPVVWGEYLREAAGTEPGKGRWGQYPVKAIWPESELEKDEVLAADAAWAEANGARTYPQRLREYNEQVQFVIAPHVDIGLVFVFAVSSLAVYAVILGGWSSNSKYSFMGSLRASAQLISYEIPMGLAALGVLVTTGSLNLEKIIDAQFHGGWNVLFQPLAALLFVTAVFAECNRLPFDLPECEQELVAGYHTEYSALKFGLFMLGEYTHMITTSFLVSILFFGGWLLPGVTEPVFLGDQQILGSIVTPEDMGVLSMILKLIVLSGKMCLVVAFFMFIRWTIPRFRFDQLMGLAWKVLMPLALVNLVCVVVVKYLATTYEPVRAMGAQSSWLLLPLSLLVLIGAGWITLNMPREPSKVPLTVRGHNTGQPAAPTESRTVSI